VESDLVPPGLTYLADNIVTKQNILGVSKEQGARWAHHLNLPSQGETIFFAGCGYQFSAQLEVLMSLARGVDKSVIGSELPMRFARFQKKLGLNLPAIYSNVISYSNSLYSNVISYSNTLYHSTPLTRGKEKTRGVEPEIKPLEVKPLEAVVKVLRNLGIRPAYLGKDEPCCGATLYHAGLQSKFSDNAYHAYQVLKNAGVRRIISVVPYCTHALQKLFPLFIKDYNLEVRHFLEIVAEKISLYKLRYPRPVRVTYHDPCQMVRYMNLIEEPRRILRAIEGVTLVEPEWTRSEWATCCGGGGGFETVFPELSEVLAVNRVTELLETKPDIIVTHCPGCIMQLKDGLRKLKVEDVEVLDLSEVVATAMEP
jgi:heterodisulfide reductase subunit B